MNWLRPRLFLSVNKGNKNYLNGWAYGCMHLLSCYCSIMTTSEFTYCISTLVAHYLRRSEKIVVGLETTATNRFRATFSTTLLLVGVTQNSHRLLLGFFHHQFFSCLFAVGVGVPFLSKKS